MQIKTIDAALELKAVNDDGYFAGYGSVFSNVDAYRDVIAPGAFKNSLAAWQTKGRLPPLLWQHDQAQPIGVYTAMSEDTRGLRVEGRLLKDEVRQAGEAYALMKAGALSGLSIGFITKADTWDTAKKTRSLQEIDLHECSLVTIPANGEARVTMVKSAEAITTIREFEGMLREAGFSHARAKAIALKGFKAADEADTEAEAIDALQALLRRMQGSHSA